MAVRQILELCFSDEDARAVARAALAERVGAHRGTLEGVIELAHADDTRALLFVTADDDATLGRSHAQIVEPWLAQCHLVRPADRRRVTIVWSDRDGPTTETIGDEDRCAQFVAAVCDSGTVWGLYGTTWARADVGGQVEALPFWSSRAEAARCVCGDWAEYGPRAIDLDDFVAQWLTAMIEDGIVVVVGSNVNRLGAIVDPVTLLERLAAGQ